MAEAEIIEPLQRLGIPVADLNIDPANARMHGERNIASIKASLARFGQRKPVVVQRRGMVVRAGNGTVEAARQLGWTRIAAVVVDEGDVSATAYAIADNRSAELAEWDDGTLVELLRALPDDLVPETGFTAAEIDELIAGLTDEIDVQEVPVPEPPDEAITRQGDLWLLGEHRLLCGDSADTEAVNLLVDGNPIHLVNTDPPYNVKVEPRSNNAIAAGLSSFQMTASVRLARAQARGMHHQGFDLARDKTKSKPTGRMRPKDRPLANDFVSDETFGALLLAWFGNIARVLLPGRAFYVWGGYGNIGNYPPALKASGLYFSQSIIWDKQHPVLTRKDFMGAHEWAFYGWREGAAHQFFGPPNVPDLWSVKKVSPQSMVHLTEKPVELAVRAMQYSSRPGENVLDLFGGSGSTLIGAEQANRRAFLMEIDPPYCDVIVTRWTNLTKEKARLVRDGTTLEVDPRAPEAHL